MKFPLYLGRYRHNFFLVFIIHIFIIYIYINCIYIICIYINYAYIIYNYICAYTTITCIYMCVYLRYILYYNYFFCIFLQVDCILSIDLYIQHVTWSLKPTRYSMNACRTIFIIEFFPAFSMNWFHQLLFIFIKLQFTLG